MPETIHPLPAISINETEAVSHGSLPADDSASVHEHQPTATTRIDAKAWDLNTTVGAPVDRLELANNLYAAGETELAFDVYAEIDLKSLGPTDQHWSIMQLANCYRHLGDLDEAAKHYRQLADVDDPPWMGELSRWWLKAIDTRKTVMQRSEQFEATLSSLKDQLNAERQP